MSSVESLNPPAVPELGSLTHEIPAFSENQLKGLEQYLKSSRCASGTPLRLDASVALIVVHTGCVSVEMLGQNARLLHAGTTLVGEGIVGSRTAQPLFRATTECQLLTLSSLDFGRVKQSNPTLAVELLQWLVGTTLDSIAQIDPIRSHLKQKSLPILSPMARVQIHGREHLVPLGTRLKGLLPERIDALPVVAALVDKKATSLHEPISSACTLEPLTTAHWEGRRSYRHSLALVAIEAARSLDRGINVSIGPSVGFGRRLLLRQTNGLDLVAFASQLEDKMKSLVQDNPSLKEELWTIGAAQAYFSQGGWHEAEQLLETWHARAVPVVSYGKIYAINTYPLLPDLSRTDGFYLLLDEDMLLLVYGERTKGKTSPIQSTPLAALTDVCEQPRSLHRSQSTRPTSNVTPGELRAQMVEQARSAAANRDDAHSQEHAWLKTLGIDSIGAFNRACVERSVPQLIRVAEAFQEKHLTRIADEIDNNLEKIDVICIAGPSSSGKTTFIRRLSVQLHVSGINPIALSMDDFYRDRALTPQDASGDYDFECIEALDIPLLHSCLSRLLAGQEVTTPRYDFKAGISHPEGGPKLCLKKHDLLLLEGIHGLNPSILSQVVRQRVYRIFVCPLMQLPIDHLSRVHASDVRLLRRIVRDRHYRKINATDTIERWPKVREGERAHIYPYQPHADAVFDSALVYELSVLRVYAERYLLEVPQEHPSYTTAYRLLHLLDRVVSIYPDQVPPNSILREFIGGSGFEY